MSRMKFLLVGAQKCGTTSLHAYLSQHPQIFMPKLKEMLFFSQDANFQQGEEYLDVFFGRVPEDLLVGASDVDILWKPKALENIHAFDPDMKLIVVLRNPAERAYSAFWYEKQKCRESAAGFAQAIRVAGDPSSTAHKFGYLSRGMYASQIKTALKYFPGKNLHIMLFEDLKNDFDATMEKIFIFLGISSEFKVNDRKMENVTGAPRNKFVQKLIFDRDIWFKELWRKYIPMKIRMKTREKIFRPLHKFNYKKSSYPAIEDAEYRNLLAIFEPEILELQELVSRDLSAWLLPRS